MIKINSADWFSFLFFGFAAVLDSDIVYSWVVNFALRSA
jgi:hypothetical protein